MSGLTPPGGRSGADPEPTRPPDRVYAPLPSTSYRRLSDPRLPPDATDVTLSGVALGLSLALPVPLAPVVGTCLAMVALVRRRFRSTGMISTALVLGLLVSAIQVVALVSVIGEMVNESKPPGGREGTLDVHDLAVGDCFDSATVRGHATGGPTDTREVEARPCEQEHDLEVFELIELTGEDLPDREEIEGLAERCLTAFAEFVGRPYDDSSFEVYYLYPTETSWRLRGDRDLTCVAGHPRRQVTGSLRGRNR
ncbi:septum formation family protein [Nocardioides sp. L-11A]|uniref:septum formation family protein n=1 Tax=Nocardioides sp. L-11A TaxID=3043848 RepID=UPI002499B595|nr:septum formation family protein [Nocardioides sp. L-11A]